MIRAALFFALGLRALDAGAQLQVEDHETAKALATLDLDLAVPESPAFTALGLNPEDITRPGTARSLAAALLTALDKQGNFQTGVALDTLPYVLARGNDFDLAEYRTDPVSRFLARSQLSIATTKGTDDDDESVRLGLGTRFTLWSKADPRMDDTLLGCLLNATVPEGASAIPRSPGAEPSEIDPDAAIASLDDEGDAAGPAGETLDEYLERTDKAFEEAQKTTAACLNQAEGRLSGGSALDLGAAPTWIQKGGSGRGVDWGGATFWGSLSLRRFDFMSPARQESEDPSDDLQLILHARLRFGEALARNDPMRPFVDQDSLLVGGRLRTGLIDLGSQKLVASIEGSYLHENPEGGSSDSSFRGGLGLDFKVWSQVWLHASLGASAAREDNRIFIGASLKWGSRNVDLMDLVKVYRAARKQAGGGQEGSAP